MSGSFGISHSRLLDLLQSWSTIGGTSTVNLPMVKLIHQSISSSTAQNSSMELHSTLINPPPHSPEVTDHKPATQLTADVKPVVDEKSKGRAIPAG